MLKIPSELHRKNTALSIPSCNHILVTRDLIDFKFLEGKIGSDHLQHLSQESHDGCCYIRVRHDQGARSDKSGEHFLLLENGKEANQASHGVAVNEGFQARVQFYDGLDVFYYRVNKIVHGVDVDSCSRGSSMPNVVVADY